MVDSIVSSKNNFEPWSYRPDYSLTSKLWHSDKTIGKIARYTGVSLAILAACETIKEMVKFPLKLVGNLFGLYKYSMLKTPIDNKKEETSLWKKAFNLVTPKDEAQKEIWARRAKRTLIAGAVLGVAALMDGYYGWQVRNKAMEFSSIGYEKSKNLVWNSYEKTTSSIKSFWNNKVAQFWQSETKPVEEKVKGKSLFKPYDYYVCEKSQPQAQITETKPSLKQKGVAASKSLVGQNNICGISQASQIEDAPKVMSSTSNDQKKVFQNNMPIVDLSPFLFKPIKGTSPSS